jgi:hypothetical protein
MNTFSELYKQNYLDKEDLVPILMQTREATSYPLIKKQLERYGESLGITFEVIELKTYKEGQDIMHPIIIKPHFKE